MHRVIGKGKGSKSRQPHPFDDVFGQHEKDAFGRGPQDLPDPDLFCPPFGRKRGQPEKPEACEENGDSGEGRQAAAQPDFASVNPVDGFVQKFISEGKIGRKFSPCLLQVLEGSRNVVGAYFERDVSCPADNASSVDVPQPQGFDLVVKGFEMEVFDDADHDAVMPVNLTVFSDGIFPGGSPGRHFVENNGFGPVGAHLFHHFSAPLYLESVEVDVVEIHGAEPDKLGFFFSHPTHAHSPGYVQGVGIGNRAVQDLRGLFESVKQRFVIAPQFVIVQGDENHEIIKIAHAVFCEVMDLVFDDQKASDQSDGDDELCQDEAFAQEGRRSRVLYQVSPEQPCRLEGREVKSRMESGSDADKKRNTEENRQVGKDGKLQIPIHQSIEPGKQEHDGEGRDRKGYEREKDRFPEELPDEASPPGPDDLPEPDFPKPFCGPGRGKGHVVEAGDEDDEKDRCRKNIDVPDVVCLPLLVYQSRTKMNLPQGLRKIDISFLFVSYVRGPDEFVQFFLEPGGICIVFQHNEGVEIMGDPPVQPLLSPKGVECRHRGQEVELEIGIFRHILQNAPDDEFMSVVECQRLSQWIFIPEIFIGHFLGYEEAERLFKGIGITHDERIGENILEIRVHTKEPDLTEHLIFVPVRVPKVSSPVDKPCRVLHFGEIFLESGGKQSLGSGEFEVPAQIVGVYSVYAVGVFVKVVEGQFESDIQSHQNADEKADRKAGDVDKGIKFLAFDIPQCDFCEIFYHDSSEQQG